MRILAKSRRLSELSHAVYFMARLNLFLVLFILFRIKCQVGDGRKTETVTACDPLCKTFPVKRSSGYFCVFHTFVFHCRWLTAALSVSIATAVRGLSGGAGAGGPAQVWYLRAGLRRLLPRQRPLLRLGRQPVLTLHPCVQEVTHTNIHTGKHAHMNIHGKTVCTQTYAERLYMHTNTHTFACMYTVYASHLHILYTV